MRWFQQGTGILKPHSEHRECSLLWGFHCFSALTSVGRAGKSTHRSWVHRDTSCPSQDHMPLTQPHQAHICISFISPPGSSSQWHQHECSLVLPYIHTQQSKNKNANTTTCRRTVGNSFKIPCELFSSSENFPLWMCHQITGQKKFGIVPPRVVIHIGPFVYWCVFVQSPENLFSFIIKWNISTIPKSSL